MTSAPSPSARVASGTDSARPELPQQMRSPEGRVGAGRPAARGCATCGLATPPGRTYCTPVCRTLQHRYARALARVPELTATAMESEELDRPEFAEREWVLVQAAVDRLAVMQERIREARSAAGLEVPSDWP